MPRLNGCHNRPDKSPSYLGQDGYFPAFSDGFGRIGRSPLYVEIEHVMTEDCQYSKHTDDPKCTGCRHNQRVKTPNEDKQ